MKIQIHRDKIYSLRRVISITSSKAEIGGKMKTWNILDCAGIQDQKHIDQICYLKIILEQQKMTAKE
jgi:hypothetical protein